MSDEERSGRGIGDRSVFKPPPKKSEDVKPTQIPDSSPAYEVNRAEVEARRKLKQDVRIYLEERNREEEEKEATRDAQEHAKTRDAQEQEEELKCMRKIMYESKTELDRMKNTVQELREENKRLLKENEFLSKSATTKSISNHQYNTTHTPEFKTISRKALIRGSPVNKETYDEDPRGYRDTGMYEIDGTPWQSSQRKRLTRDWEPAQTNGLNAS
jgi:hypothetical protein